MRGPKKDKVNLAEQGVVTEEALIAYLHNELSPEEKQELEKLLLEDPFAADALEGLKSSSNQAAVTVSISSLKKKVRERSGLKERKALKIHWVTFAWAAVVIGLLIGISFILVNFLNKANNTQDLALKEKKETTNSPVANPIPPVSEKLSAIDSTSADQVNARDTVPHAAGGADTATRRIAQTATGNSTTSATKVVTTPPTAGYMVNSTVVASNNGTGEAKKYEPLKADQNADNKYSQSSQKDSVSTMQWPANTAKPGKTDERKNEAAKPEKDLGSLQEDAMKSFNSGDYNTAGDDFDRILKIQPDNADALYFGAISDYINGKTSKSETSFDKLLKKGNKYIEGSKWYKANILLKKGKTDSAKSLLQDLSNGNSSYKERAIKKLAELGF